MEFEDDEARDSLTAASPCGSTLIESTSFVKLPALRRVTGGRVSRGLLSRSLVWFARNEATRPGDCEQIDVGVVSRLNEPGPGDSENLVEGLPLVPDSSKLAGVRGGKSCVANRNGTSKPKSDVSDGRRISR